ncbi:hypothetical protein BDV93DRAFT_561848 [Ceratobasidium sp. AG-I]|nr:hypothetical protein BDV93DRAFT_561848 [Ceratobasidium sp. AG-I]
MSFVSSHKVLDPSLRFLREASGKIVDRTMLMRLLFPGGWDDKQSDVFKWYDLQRYKSFQKVQYYKEQQSVGHEFVVLLLVDDAGMPTESFCRLERTADPTQPLTAVGTAGTEAFDYIQSLDNNLQGSTKGASLVAEITLSRAFDLRDVLAICSAIHEQPNTRRYTLQQYNCYFFCWAIILLLARRSASWETRYLPCLNTIKAAVLSSICAPPNATTAKIAHTLSHAHRSSKTSAPSLLSTVLVSELSSSECLQLANKTLSSVLWAHRGQAQLKKALEDQSMTLAEKTLELLIGGLSVNPDAGIMHARNGGMAVGCGLDMQELTLEGCLLFDTMLNEVVVEFLDKETQRVVDELKCINSAQDPIKPQGHYRLTFVPAVDAAIGRLIMVCEVLPNVILDSLETARLQNGIAIHKKQWKGVRALKYAVNIVRNLPQNLVINSKLATVSMELYRMGILEEFASGEFYHKLNSHALDLTMANLLKKLPQRDGNVIREVGFRLIVSISEKTGLGGLSPKRIWQHLLWEFVGDIVTEAILRAVLAEQTNKTKFKCFQVNTVSPLTLP